MDVSIGRLRIIARFLDNLTHCSWQPQYKTPIESNSMDTHSQQEEQMEASDEEEPKVEQGSEEIIFEGKQSPPKTYEEDVAKEAERTCKLSPPKADEDHINTCKASTLLADDSTQKCKMVDGKEVLEESLTAEKDKLMKEDSLEGKNQDEVIKEEEILLGKKDEVMKEEEILGAEKAEVMKEEVLGCKNQEEQIEEDKVIKEDEQITKEECLGAKKDEHIEEEQSLGPKKHEGQGSEEEVVVAKDVDNVDLSASKQEQHI